MRVIVLLCCTVLALAAPAAAAAPLHPVQCFSPARGCGHGVAVSRPTGVAVAPDGRTVVVRSGIGSLGSLGVFARDRRTGRLRQIQCVARRAKPCLDGRGLETPSAIAFSPDGRSVYVTAENGRSLGIYRRLASGKLVSRGSATGLAHPHDVAVSRDGRNVYVGGDRLWVFARAASGALRLVETQPVAARAIAVSPDGLDVYAGAGGGRHGSLARLARNPATGALTRIAEAPDGTLPGIQQPAGIVAGRTALWVVGTVSGAVARFDRALRPVAVARGLPRAFGLAAGGSRVFVAYRDGVAVLTPGLRKLGTAPLRDAAGVAVAGRHVYAVSPARVSVLAR